LTFVGAYRELLKTPGVGRIIAAQLTARFPNGMISLALLLHIEHLTGSYGAAGLVLAATSVGQAVAGPVTSRWMGIWGMRRVLTLPTLVDRTITYCEPGLKGDTTGKAFKKATLDTGLVVDVPLFCEIGTKIKLDTRDGSFAERTK